MAQQIADELGIDRDTASKWRTRLNKKRVEGLTDSPRTGRPRVITSALEAQVVRLTAKPPKNATHWATRTMAERFGSELDVCVVLGNYITHANSRVEEWLGQYPRFRFYLTPTGSSWINMVERLFSKLTTERIRRGVFKSATALEDARRLGQCAQRRPEAVQVDQEREGKSSPRSTNTAELTPHYTSSVLSSTDLMA